MKTFNLKSKIAVITTLSVLAVFTIGGLAYYSLKLYSKNTELLKNIESLKSDLKNSKDEINELQKDKVSSNTAMVDLRNNISQANAINDDLNDKIGAFAKQAASCDRIKKRLHIKD